MFMDENEQVQESRNPELRPMEGGAPVQEKGQTTTNNFYYQTAPKKSGCLKAFIVALLIFIAVLILFGAVIFGFIGLCAAFADSFDSMDASLNKKVKENILRKGSSDNVIAVIDVKGIIARAKGPSIAASEKIVELIEYVKDNVNDYSGLIIDMDTPGGEVIAADEIHSAIRKLKETDAGFPVVTCMHSMGASGGYYVAAATDVIVANRMTFTGSIGVIMSSYNITDLIGKIGVSQQVFRSGDMKDMLSSTRKLTEKETTYIQQMIDSTFNEFAKIVANGREAYKNEAEVKAAPFGDGRVLSGADALEFKLVDKLGDFDDAVEIVMDKAELTGNPKIVQLVNNVSFMDSLMELKEQLPLQSRLIPGNAAVMKAGHLYYLAPHAAL